MLNLTTVLVYGLAIVLTVGVIWETWHLVDWWIPHLAEDPVGCLKDHAHSYLSFLGLE